MKVSNKHFDRLQSGIADVSNVDATPGKVYKITSQDKRSCSALCLGWVSPKKDFIISRFQLLK